MTRKNYRDDFDFLLRLYSAYVDSEGNELADSRRELGWPDYDWTARIYTSNKANAYTASCIGGVCTNCFNDDGNIRIVVNDHHMGPGTLKVEFRAELPREIYPDGFQRNVIPAPLDIELTVGRGDLPGEIEANLLMPYIKGEPFTYEDFTPEQIADLMRPATEAATRADAAVTEAVAATAQAVESNRRLAEDVARIEGDELKREEAETTRQNAEAVRQANETARQSNETARQGNETSRENAEQTRVRNESDRATAETVRAEAESARDSAESFRATNELARQSDEQTRIASEQSRVSAESSRVTQEQSRVSAEAIRDADETKRRAAETMRAEAEVARETAEDKRAVEFASWETELDNKADRTELSNIIGTPTEGIIEDIEPTLVTSALRKGPQILTSEEQSQVKENLGISKMELFCDLFNAAAGSYGYARLVDGVFDCMLNRLTLTYVEAVSVLEAGDLRNNGENFYRGCLIRTNLPRKYGNAAFSLPHTFYNCTMLETATVYLGVVAAGTFEGCVNLTVIGSQDRQLYKINGGSRAFKGCSSLEEVYGTIRDTGDLNVSDSPRLTLDNFRRWISSAVNTAPITITVHPNVYAKIAEESNVEWHQVLADAIVKNITFATI